nr:uncharacterized protein LOC127348184 [Lolium perenne]
MTRMVATLERARAPQRPVSSDRPSLSAPMRSSASAPGSRQTSPLARPRPITVAEDDDDSHNRATHVALGPIIWYQSKGCHEFDPRISPISPKKFPKKLPQKIARKLISGFVSVFVVLIHRSDVPSADLPFPPFFPINSFQFGANLSDFGPFWSRTARTTRAHLLQILVSASWPLLPGRTIERLLRSTPTRAKPPAAASQPPARAPACGLAPANLNLAPPAAQLPLPELPPTQLAWPPPAAGRPLHLPPLRPNTCSPCSSAVPRARATSSKPPPVYTHLAAAQRATPAPRAQLWPVPARLRSPRAPPATKPARTPGRPDVTPGKSARTGRQPGGNRMVRPRIRSNRPRPDFTILTILLSNFDSTFCSKF